MITNEQFIAFDISSKSRVNNIIHLNTVIHLNRPTATEILNEMNHVK